MKSSKLDTVVAKITASVMALATVVAIPYLAQMSHQGSLERSMTKAITCIEKSCMNYKQLSDSTEWYAGELDYVAIGKEHKTTLGNADFYRVNVGDDAYLFRVDGSKHIVIQYFKLNEAGTERALIHKYAIY